MFEINAVRSVLEKCVPKKCPKCSTGEAKVSFSTCCLSTGIKIACASELCGFLEVQRPQTTDIPLRDEDGSALKECSTDYAVNVLCMLGFLSCGDGGKQAQKLLGLLSLSNSTTMEKRSFPDIEK